VSGQRARSRQCDWEFAGPPPAHLSGGPESQFHSLPDARSPFEFAQIQNGARKGEIRFGDSAVHAQRGFPNVKHVLLWKTEEPPANRHGVLEHAERHGWIIGALQFDLDQQPPGGFPEQINEPTAERAKFAVGRILCATRTRMLIFENGLDWHDLHIVRLEVERPMLDDFILGQHVGRFGRVVVNRRGHI
jgi:hypothetical protein